MNLPLPPHFQSQALDQVWRVPYQERAIAATAWAEQHQIRSAEADQPKVALLIIDAQNTFCIPGFELFVGGRSGRGAVEDNRRLCEFIYRNLGEITEIIPTLDTHTALQIFHPIFWVDRQGRHPTPAVTTITLAEVEAGDWRVNPAIAADFLHFPPLAGPNLEADPDNVPVQAAAPIHDLEQYVLHYTRSLTQAGKFPLTIWPYHSMLGGIGHALVAGVEEAVFFHSIARTTATRFELKGSHPLTENYSVLRPEVMQAADGTRLTSPNQQLIDHLLSFDRIAIAGQAKSHCVAWTIADLLGEIQRRQQPELAGKIDLLEDCMSPVVVPGIIDFTDTTEATFAQFAAAGMRRITSTAWS